MCADPENIIMGSQTLLFSLVSCYLLRVIINMQAKNAKKIAQQYIHIKAHKGIKIYEIYQRCDNSSKYSLMFRILKVKDVSIGRLIRFVKKKMSALTLLFRSYLMQECFKLNKIDNILPYRKQGIKKLYLGQFNPELFAYSR